MRQLFTESLVIALLGGALGIVIGVALTAAVPALAPADFPRLDEIRVDARFLVVAVLAAIFAGVVSGAAPALRGSRIDLAAAMQSGGARTVGTSGARMRRMLLAIEAALAVVLLIGAALLARSFAALVTVDAGYDADRVLTADVRLPADPADKNDARTSQRAVALVERLRAIPGVRAAGAGDMAPFGSLLSSFGFTLPGMTGADGQAGHGDGAARDRHAGIRRSAGDAVEGRTLVPRRGHVVGDPSDPGERGVREGVSARRTAGRRPHASRDVPALARRADHGHDRRRGRTTCCRRISMRARSRRSSWRRAVARTSVTSRSC